MEEIDTQTDIARLAKRLSQMHSQNLNQSKIPVYNVQWVINLVNQSKNREYTGDIISTLEMVSRMEHYKTNHVGGYIWDIASIINYVNDSSFSDIFLESYIFYSNRKLTLIALYANLYYVRVAEAIQNDTLDDIMPMTRELLNENEFKTEVISSETLSRLQIVGF